MSEKDKAASFDPEAFLRESRVIWNEAAPHYASLSARLFGHVSRIFVEFAGVKAGDRALDVACGTGMATINAVKAVGPSGQVLAVDFSSEMLKRAARNVRSRAAGGAPLEFREMSAEKLDIPDRAFDAVLCQLGLMLFAQPYKALAEMARVAAPGGRVACLVQGSPDKMLFTSLLNKTMVRHAPNLRVPGAPTIYDFAPEGVLEKAFAGAGLKAVKTKRVEGTFRFASFEEYWEMMAGAGRTGVILDSLEPSVRHAVKDEVVQKAVAFKTADGISIPYEFVMSSGAKPS